MTRLTRLIRPVAAWTKCVLKLASKGTLRSNWITCLTVKAVNARDEEDICHCSPNGPPPYTVRLQKHLAKRDSLGRLGPDKCGPYSCLNNSHFYNQRK